MCYKVPHASEPWRTGGYGRTMFSCSSLGPLLSPPPVQAWSRRDDDGPLGVVEGTNGMQEAPGKDGATARASSFGSSRQRRALQGHPRSMALSASQSQDGVPSFRPGSCAQGQCSSGQVS